VRGAEANGPRSEVVTLSEAEQILESARGVLVVDWPSREVPDALAGGGYTVIVKGGPEPDRYSVRELRGGEVVSRELDRPPAQVDLVYRHRPIGELRGIVDLASARGAGDLAPVGRRHRRGEGPEGVLGAGRGVAPSPRSRRGGRPAPGGGCLHRGCGSPVATPPVAHGAAAHPRELRAGRSPHAPARSRRRNTASAASAASAAIASITTAAVALNGWAGTRPTW
jgi:hypothetical protein